MTVDALPVAALSLSDSSHNFTLRDQASPELLQHVIDQFRIAGNKAFKDGHFTGAGTCQALQWLICLIEAFRFRMKG